MLLQPVNLGSQNATSAVNGATTEPRIHINPPDDENARCRVSRVRVQPKNFSQPTQPLTTLSTSNAISPPQKRTEPSGPRRCRRGATSSLRREPNMPADLLRALFGNVTVPERPHAADYRCFLVRPVLPSRQGILPSSTISSSTCRSFSVSMERKKPSCL